jgi:cytochrome c peroxidase
MLKLLIGAVSAGLLLASGSLVDRFARGQVHRAQAEQGGEMQVGDDERAILPIVPIAGLDPSRVALGRRLFHDTRLSRDGSLSCASCHGLDSGGVDGRRFSVGIDGAVGGVNAPTVLNCALNFRQFWDGRAGTLEEQAAGPIQNPAEMGATWEQVIPALAADAGYAESFRQLYPGEGISAASVTSAIATFERSLTTGGSRFDRYLRGERGAINEDEEAGYHLFMSLGCISCHQGMNVGGNLYQRFGVMGDYFADRGNPTTADLGRYNVTHREADRNVFKVPGLRDVARTAPYFHDGSVRSLAKAVVTMARYQLGTKLSSQEIDQIVQFLGCLGGESAP